MSCNVRSSASGAVGAGADEDVHQTVHWTPPVTLQDTWSYCSGVMNGWPQSNTRHQLQHRLQSISHRSLLLSHNTVYSDH